MRPRVIFLCMVVAALSGGVLSLGFFHLLGFHRTQQAAVVELTPQAESEGATAATPMPDVQIIHAMRQLRPNAGSVAQPTLPRAAGLQADFAAAIRTSMPAVVLITAQKRVAVSSPYSNIYNYGRDGVDIQEVPSGQGSGFFVRENGYILTNFHVVRGQDSFWITTHDGTEYEAKVAGIDPATDLALLKVESNKRFPVLRFADPEQVEIGHWAIAIGAPFSLSRTVTVGIVSQKGRSGVGVNLQESYIQTDASINPGNSGGPLLNIHGEVIGVADFIMSPSGGNIGLSFAIASDIAKKISDELVRHGHVERPWLGVIMEPLSREARRQLGIEHGVLIARMFRDSPAADTLRYGDVVLEADGVKIDSPGTLRSRVLSLSPGATLKLKILRDNVRRDLSVKVAPSPRNWLRGQNQTDARMVNQF